MAFVRWRGNCAQLLTTIYDHGRIRQVLLANFHSASYADESIKQCVASQFPQIKVDWRVVDLALAQGPPTEPPVPPEHLDWAMVEHYLRDWARLARYGREADHLNFAAEVLMSWRAQRPYMKDPLRPRTQQEVVDSKSL